MKQVLLIILTTFLTSTVCKANVSPSEEINLFKKIDPIETFWTWFKQNEKRLRKFEEDPGKYLEEILTKAQEIQEGLVIELEPPKNGTINLTVSADGDRELFETVQKVVDRSPKIEGWKFIAFRQRMTSEQLKTMKLKLGSEELDPQKMKFFPMIEGDSLDIIIYIKGIRDENYIGMAYQGLLLLDNILGEYDCVKKVRSYDFHDMPTKKEELEGLLPLLDIASYVDNFHISKKK